MQKWNVQKDTRSSEDLQWSIDWPGFFWLSHLGEWVVFQCEPDTHQNLCPSWFCMVSQSYTLCFRGFWRLKSTSCSICIAKLQLNWKIKSQAFCLSRLPSSTTLLFFSVQKRPQLELIASGDAKSFQGTAASQAFRQAHEKVVGTILGFASFFLEEN